MVAIRTQIYLSHEQRERVDELAAAEGVTMAEIVRRALAAYVKDHPDVSDALASTFGADPEATVPSRDEWRRG